MALKKEIRILGIDDSAFYKESKDQILVIGTVFRGGTTLDGVISTSVEKDGTDATDQLIEMIKKSKFFTQIQFVMLDGIALGGFNIVDVKKLSEKINIPVVVVMRQYPDILSMINALQKIGFEDRIRLIKQLDAPVPIGKIHVQWVNTTQKSVEQVLKLTCINSNIPEPVRAAHLIGSGIIKGESSGQA